MGANLYVGNLSHQISSAELEQLFAEYGTVKSAQVIMDRETGRSKGFAFVEMSDDAEAKAAIASLNLKEISGRCVTVAEARPRQENSRGGGGGYGGGRGGRRPRY
ncbi:MAG: RNA-binding protein [Planctomycetes bacterium]|nr:RNA-binding protein [Planctomycetota bacterium]